MNKRIYPGMVGPGASRIVSIDLTGGQLEIIRAWDSVAEKEIYKAADGEIALDGVVRGAVVAPHMTKERYRFPDVQNESKSHTRHAVPCSD